MKRGDKKVVDIFVRYILIFILGLGNLAVFYTLFTKPTINLSFFFLNLIAPSTQLFGSSILFNTVLIKIVPACIAGSAYYLLTILILSVPNIKPLKRLLAIVFAFALFFALNVARIVIYSNIATLDLFNTLHLIGWYLISTIIVVGIWFLTVKIFKIKDLPIHADFKFLASTTKKKSKRSVKKTKKTKRSKKN